MSECCYLDRSFPFFLYIYKASVRGVKIREEHRFWCCLSLLLSESSKEQFASTNIADELVHLFQKQTEHEKKEMIFEVLAPLAENGKVPEFENPKKSYSNIKIRVCCPGVRKEPLTAQLVITSQSESGFPDSVQLTDTSCFCSAALFPTCLRACLNSRECILASVPTPTVSMTKFYLTLLKRHLYAPPVCHSVCCSLSFCRSQESELCG